MEFFLSLLFSQPIQKTQNHFGGHIFDEKEMKIIFVCTRPIFKNIVWQKYLKDLSYRFTICRNELFRGTNYLSLQRPVRGDLAERFNAFICCFRINYSSYRI